MKKVFVISNMYPTDQHLSYGIFVKNQVDALEQAGVETLVGVNTNPATGAKNVAKKYMLWASRVLKIGSANRKSISITHAHYVFPSGMFSFMMKKLWNIPYIVTAHGGDIERMAKKNERIRNWTTKILHESAHIIAVGPVLADQIHEDFGIARDKITVMSMGVNREVFKPGNKTEARASLGIDHDEFLFSFVGNVIEQKGVEELLKAFEIVQSQTDKKCRLVIIGSRRDTAFLERIQPLVNEKVKFVDPVQQPHLVTWFQASDVFVLPSHIEGFGLVALEALATGTPVIASRVGGLVSLLENGAGHLVNTRDMEALAEEMLTAMKSVDYYNVEKAEEVLQLHDEKNIIRRLKNIYKTAIEQGVKR